MKAMNFSPSKCKEELRQNAFAAGFSRFGVAEATPVSNEAIERHQRWISRKFNASMDYMARNESVRFNPALLLEGANSVIVLAANYRSHDFLPGFARYALGDDYHEVLRHKATPLLDTLSDYGFNSRIFVDTAPVPERYWAVEAGIGFIGRNSTLIVPGSGSFFFLAVIVTEAPLPPDAPTRSKCCGCGACIKKCPVHAIKCDGMVDASKCLSYLTIEHRGEFPEGTDLHGRIFGCDICQEVCPHNMRPVEPVMDEFRMRKEYSGLDREKILSMTQEDFSRIFHHSAIKRAKLAGLQRNCRKSDD